jgi:hypothetical protein
MSNRLRQAAVAVVVLFAGAQLFNPDRTNPPTDPSRTLAAHAATQPALAAVINRSCGDCHSNATTWPWYAKIAPLSWAMAYGVNAGRNAVNFSEWAAYSAEQQRSLLAASCSDASHGKMPDGFWTFLHPDTRLAAGDIETICAAARQ